MNLSLKFKYKTNSSPPISQKKFLYDIENKKNVIEFLCKKLKDKNIDRKGCKKDSDTEIVLQVFIKKQDEAGSNIYQILSLLVKTLIRLFFTYSYTVDIKW